MKLYKIVVKEAVVYWSDT